MRLHCVVQSRNLIPEFLKCGPCFKSFIMHKMTVTDAETEKLEFFFDGFHLISNQHIQFFFLFTHFYHSSHYHHAKTWHVEFRCHKISSTCAHTLTHTCIGSKVMEWNETALPIYTQKEETLTLTSLTLGREEAFRISKIRSQTL